MISELAGFVLSRSIPDNLMLGVLAGVNKVYGGVVRNEQGQILAHLVNSTTPSNILSAFTSPLNTLLSGVNTYQLHRIGGDVGVIGAEVGRIGAEVGAISTEVSHIGANVTQLLQLAQASMLLSGLTLAVSSAGFLFLSNKINKIDEKLQQVASDVKYIKSFLELQERSRLIAALKVIRELNKVEDHAARLQMLISSRQTIGEIHEKYKMLLTDSSNEYSFMAAEEYFTITAIGHSLCSAELDMYDQALNDLHDAQNTWQSSSRAFVKNHVINDNAQRFLTKDYVQHINSAEVIEWVDFAESSSSGISILDHLRGQPQKRSFGWSKLKGVDTEEKLNLEVSRKIIARNKILQGYIDQLKYLSQIRQKPSTVQNFMDSIPCDNSVEGCHIFIADAYAN
ncbi:hypothetical protein [Thiothrix winogradskyi]|uniref:Uncharacterized protein n=1 Tax=Thiothrix winogradskyi TaxID=96472 RepID=A0ABY3SUA1_9GAMM|nr:hypothetical protein [Thiothrix winogradskyi]UJS23053.1 hypothetical protein L2Y54_14010 [Thiothrix winogradskyi]